MQFVKDHAPALVITVLGAVVGAYLGAYFTEQRALENAPERTVAGANTLVATVGELREALGDPTPEVADLLKQVEVRARGLENNAQIVARTAGVATAQSDFWLREGQAVRLGGRSQIAVQDIDKRNPNAILVRFNDERKWFYGGESRSFPSNDRGECRVTYMGKSPGDDGYGFGVDCEKPPPES